MSRGPQERLAPAPSDAEVMRLPDALVDQIAAGEVVERPASVVKELVENAVDAGAERIRVEVREGGNALVAVTDDGSGMSPENARRALERHATSKLRALDDLTAIASFGFRGEALPAIASVSRFRLRSRPAGAETAIEIRTAFGGPHEEREVASPPGTRIEVAELFGAIPARRKFLKRPSTEWGHVSDWLSRAALALPAVHFDVIRDDRATLHWPAVDEPLDRIAAVLGERDAAALEQAEGEAPGLFLRAFVSRPDVHRATGAGIHLFVNGRPVRDRMLRHALLQVTRDLIPRGRFPTALLFLEVDPARVDVNVHPAKWEVRFSDPQGAHQLVRHTLREALSGRSWLGAGAAPSPERDARPSPPLQDRAPGSAAPHRSDWGFADRVREPDASPLLAPPAQSPAAPAQPSLSLETSDPTSDAERPFRFGELRLLSQLLGTYLLAEDKDGLILVDQHAAHERVLYEQLRSAWLEGGVTRQALLVPTPVELASREAHALAEHAEVVEALGFEVEPFGEGTMMVRAVPALLAERDPIGLLRGLADELGEADANDASLRPGTRILDAADHLFATLACHSARRGGEWLEPEESRALLDSLDAIPWAPSCPHGRPVAIRIDRSEIERRFSRH